MYQCHEFPYRAARGNDILRHQHTRALFDGKGTPERHGSLHPLAEYETTVKRRGKREPKEDASYGGSGDEIDGQQVLRQAENSFTGQILRETGMFQHPRTLDIGVAVPATGEPEVALAERAAVLKHGAHLLVAQLCLSVATTLRSVERRIRLA
jgi:hypothetical protein